MKKHETTQRHEKPSKVSPLSFRGCTNSVPNPTCSAALVHQNLNTTRFKQLLITVEKVT